MRKMIFIIFAVFLFAGVAYAQGDPPLNVNVNAPKITSTSLSNSETFAAGIGFQTITSVPPLLQNPPIFPFPVPLIQGGKVGDITEQLPHFKGLKPLKISNGESEEVEEVEVFSGSIFSRTRLQNLWPDILKYYKKVLDKGWDPAKIRYRVYYKDSAMGAGVGGGGGVGGSGISTAGTSGIQGMGAILPGYTRSTADPMYILIFCKIS